MNLVEGLSREIARVSEMKQEAQAMAATPGVMMGFYILSCTRSIEEGREAIGSGDIIRMATAHDQLKEIN